MRNYPPLRISARGPGLSGSLPHLTRQLSGAYYGLLSWAAALPADTWLYREALILLPPLCAKVTFVSPALVVGVSPEHAAMSPATEQTASALENARRAG